MSIRIRSATPQDADALAGVGYAAWKRGIGPLVEPAAAARVDAALYAAFIRDNAAAILVAERAGLNENEGAPLGFAAIDEDYLSDLWVDPEHEGQGAGTALLSAAAEAVRAAGHAAIRLEVMTENTRALGLYRHLGFRIVWQGQKHEDILQTDLDKTVMEKALC